MTKRSGLFLILALGFSVAHTAISWLLGPEVKGDEFYWILGTGLAGWIILFGSLAIVPGISSLSPVARSGLSLAHVFLGLVLLAIVAFFSFFTAQPPLIALQVTLIILAVTHLLIVGVWLLLTTMSAQG